MLSIRKISMISFEKQHSRRAAALQRCWKGPLHKAIALANLIRLMEIRDDVKLAQLVRAQEC